jgi:hypothetical protein
MGVCRLSWPSGLTRLGICALVLAGCGKDSNIADPLTTQAPVEFGDGIELVTPADTLIRFFEEFTPVTINGRPAIPLRQLVGESVVPRPDLHGFRFIGTDGFYANMPGKEYGDNTWEQLALGHLDLIDFRVVFQTELDESLRKGHNVKYLIRVEVLRSLDVTWADGRKLAPVGELTPVTIPAGYPESGMDGLPLASFVSYSLPGDLTPSDFLYRVLSRTGASLPRLLTWEEVNATYYLPASDRVVMAEALGAAYQVDEPKTVRAEALSSGEPRR